MLRVNLVDSRCLSTEKSTVRTDCTPTCIYPVVHVSELLDATVVVCLLTETTHGKQSHQVHSLNTVIIQQT